MAETVENIEEVEEIDDTVDVLLRDVVESGVDTVEPIMSGSGVESAVIRLHAWSGSVPNRLCCSGVR